MAIIIKEVGSEKNQQKVEDKIKHICKKGALSKEKADKRFCYYIGGSEDAATSMLRTISGPLKNHLPAEKICEKLKAADAQICTIKVEKPEVPVDWSTAFQQDARERIA